MNTTLAVRCAAARRDRARAATQMVALAARLARAVADHPRRPCKGSWQHPYAPQGEAGCGVVVLIPLDLLTPALDRLTATLRGFTRVVRAIDAARPAPGWRAAPPQPWAEVDALAADTADQIRIDLHRMRVRAAEAAGWGPAASAALRCGRIQVARGRGEALVAHTRLHQAPAGPDTVAAAAHTLQEAVLAYCQAHPARGTDALATLRPAPRGRP